MKRWILYILLGLIVFFIWDNSMQNGGSSDGFSLLFAETLTPIANKLGFHGNIWTLNRIVRKLAHLTEFTIPWWCFIYDSTSIYYIWYRN